MNVMAQNQSTRCSAAQPLNSVCSSPAALAGLRMSRSQTPAYIKPNSVSQPSKHECSILFIRHEMPNLPSGPPTARLGKCAAVLGTLIVQQVMTRQLVDESTWKARLICGCEISFARSPSNVRIFSCSKT